MRGKIIGGLYEGYYFTDLMECSFHPEAWMSVRVLYPDGDSCRRDIRIEHL